MNLPEILSEKGAKGVGGRDKRRPEILKLMAMPSTPQQSTAQQTSFLTQTF